MLLVGYLYGVTSERKLVEELRMHPGSAKGGGTVRRAEELHRTTPPEATPDALRARAILPGGYSAEPETAGAIPQPEVNRADGNCMNLA